MSDHSSQILFHRRAHAYGDLVYNSIVPEARTIMGSGQFNLESLGNLRAVSPNWPTQAGVYLIIYEDFGGVTIGSTTYRIALYFGQTVQFYGRLNQHQQGAQTKTSAHYRLAKKAGTMRMVPIILSPGGNVPESFLDIAEFSMVCLFRTWFSALFRPSETSAVGAYATDFDACIAFSSLMRDVSLRTGWAPGRTYGVNWQTPILTHPRPDFQWTSWYLEGKDLYVYRTRRQIKISPGHVEIHWQSGREVSIPAAVAREAGFEHNQSIHLVVEIKKKNGEYLTHPFRFMRFPPQIGLNPELEKLRSMAVRIEWVNEQGNWKSYYLEREKTWQPMPNSTVPAIYRHALFIMCNVEQTVFNNPPAWTLPTAPARVNFLRYNHMQQKLVVEVRPLRHRQWPPDNTIAQNTQRLEHMFPPGPNSDTIIGERPGKAFLGNFRTACDLCFSQSTTTKCQYDSTTHTCQNCRRLNRPCTFSRSGNLIQDFVYGQRLEELGIAPHMARSGSMTNDMERAPFDPSIEEEEHANLAAD
ncbi:unnamed protein product [Fusarium graminearum]|uniref:Uncharacterized protein n=1 Tax=Gibberella zeae TaxID=5518 RepID=A0A2H3FI10_GIBZA|nr:hypothetical protein FGRA07_05534 [Fusarium graminearum]CAF3473395.1 unnamed protein product [Fusarium graminearum]CAF3508569.1 unnamed protein product [Fusarium graminearum]CAG1979224.1 unnamed protein product [Fusarium graminearum]CAG1988606.1 unnamed protein product [Fusarium graminearum]